MRLAFDIETDGLPPDYTTVWMVVAREVDGDGEWIFCDHHGGRPLSEFKQLLYCADELIGHNIINFDIPALKDLCGFVVNPKTKITDTMIMSQLLNYTRFKGNRHNLRVWGEHLGFPKGDHDMWHMYSPEMLEYCRQDVRIQVEVFKALDKELADQAKHRPMITQALEVEHRIQSMMTDQCRAGWTVNRQAMLELMTLISQDMREIEEFIEPKLRIKVVNKGTFKAKFKKDGTLYASTIKHIGNVEINEPVPFEYSVVEFAEPNMGNMDSVKAFLYKIGWKPDEWNWKRLPTGEFIRVSPKLTDTSLALLGEEGHAISRYYTLRSRLSVMEGWNAHLDSNNRLHGDVFNIGTPTFRQRHGIIANLPSPKAEYGKEVRQLFIASPNKVLVSADSASNQVRVLAHYLSDKKYTDLVLNGDMHQFNADNAGITRNQAKPAYFAFLYGAGAKKIATICGCDEKRGKQIREALMNKTPNLQKIINNLTRRWEQTRGATGKGFFFGLDGRRIFAEDAFKCLNYLIQGGEAVVMKWTLYHIDKALREEGIDYTGLLFYHDEWTIEVDPQDAPQVKEIFEHWFKEAPKALGIDIMDTGGVNVGRNYYEVH